jgi:hypothetical protein
MYGFSMDRANVADPDYEWRRRAFMKKFTTRPHFTTFPHLTEAKLENFGWGGVVTRTMDYDLSCHRSG